MIPAQVSFILHHHITKIPISINRIDWNGWLVKYTETETCKQWKWFAFKQYSQMYNSVVPMWLRFVWHHDDVIIRGKHFPRYWPSVWGIHRPSVNSPHKGQWRGFDVFCELCLHKCLNKQPWRRRSETLLRYWHPQVDKPVNFRVETIPTSFNLVIKCWSLIFWVPYKYWWNGE